MVIKTILLGLVDLLVLAILIKWLFKTASEFFKCLWQAGKGTFFLTVAKDNTDDPLYAIKIAFTLIALLLLIWGEHSLFY